MTKRQVLLLIQRIVYDATVSSAIWDQDTSLEPSYMVDQDRLLENIERELSECGDQDDQ